MSVNEKLYFATALTSLLNCNFMSIYKVGLAENSERTFGLRVKLPSVSCLPHTVKASHFFSNVERQAGKL